MAADSYTVSPESFSVMTTFWSIGFAAMFSMRASPSDAPSGNVMEAAMEMFIMPFATSSLSAAWISSFDLPSNWPCAAFESYQSSSAGCCVSTTPTPTAAPTATTATSAANTCLDMPRILPVFLAASAAMLEMGCEAFEAPASEALSTDAGSEVAPKPLPCATSPAALSPPVWR